MAEESVVESKEQSLLDELAHSETVRKLIECPVCLELPLPPIYVCNKGHIVCNNCQARTYACPLCREHYSTTRGFVAEGIIEKCVLRCKFADHGCPLSMRGAALVDHLEVCDYRPVVCADCGGKLVNFDEYEDHLLKYHRINGINQSRAYVIYSMNLAHQIAFGEKCCWPQYYLKAFDNVTFLLRLYATHWFVCAWISLLGPKRDCAKYEAMLEFHPTNDDSVVHTWHGPVNHFRADPGKEIFLQGKGLITPMETLMQIAPVANDHAEWLYNIEILKANEKAETEECALNEVEENTEEAVAGPVLETPCEDKSTTESNASEISNDKNNNAITNNSNGSNPQASCSCANLLTQVIETASATPSASSTEHKSTTSTTTTSTVTPLSERTSSALRIISSETPRITSSTICPPVRTPRRPSTTSNGPRSGGTATINSSSGSNNNVLTSGPAIMSPSSSVLAQAGTVSSVVPSSVREGSQSTGNNTSSSFPLPSYNPDPPHSQGPIRVSTLRPSARLMNTIRRSAASSPFAQMLRGESRNFYGISEDDWNFSSESDE